MKRVGGVAAVLVAALMAGCAGDPAADDVEVESVVTDPTDYSYLENRTDGSGWHVHDYWRGQAELTLLEAEERSGGIYSYGGTHGVPIGTHRPSPGDVVPQGAAWINITATWSVRDEQASDYSHMELFVQSAADGDFRRIGPIDRGAPVTVESTNEMNDPPHHTLSLWRFQLRAMARDGADGATVAGYDSSIKITVARGLDIPPYPPHPDFWEGKDEIVLLEHGPGAPGFDIGATLLQFCAEACTDRWFTPDDGRIVPFDATAVVVEITFEPGVPPMLNLSYHGADTWDFTKVEPESSGPDGMTFSIPVRPVVGDSPYAKQSLWEFRTDSDQPTDPYAHAFAGAIGYRVTALKDA